MPSVVRVSLASQSAAPLLTPTCSWVPPWASQHLPRVHQWSEPGFHCFWISTPQFSWGREAMCTEAESKQCLEEMLNQKSCHPLSSQSMNDKGRLTEGLPEFPRLWVSWHALPEVNCASFAEPAPVTLCCQRWHQLVSLSMVALETQRRPVILATEICLVFYSNDKKNRHSSWVCWSGWRVSEWVTWLP